MTKQTKYIGPGALASHLGLPREWVVREAKQGNLPHITAGRRLLFDPDAVEQTLLKRPVMKEEGGDHDA